MAFMKKDVNFGLLVLIIASIILFAGFSVYYQTSFKDVSLEYQSKLEQLGQVTKELGAKRQELNETYSLKIKAEEDKQTLDIRYNEVRDENTKVKDENTILIVEVTNTKSDLAEKKAELEATKNLLSQTRASLSASQSEVTSLKSRVSNIKDDVDRICAKLVAAGGSDGDC